MVDDSIKNLRPRNLEHKQLCGFEWFGLDTKL